MSAKHKNNEMLPLANSPVLDMDDGPPQTLIRELLLGIDGMSVRNKVEESGAMALAIAAAVAYGMPPNFVHIFIQELLTIAVKAAAMRMGHNEVVRH